MTNLYILVVEASILKRLGRLRIKDLFINRLVPPKPS